MVLEEQLVRENEKIAERKKRLQQIENERLEAEAAETTAAVSSLAAPIIPTEPACMQAPAITSTVGPTTAGPRVPPFNEWNKSSATTTVASTSRHLDNSTFPTTGPARSEVKVTASSNRIKSTTATKSYPIKGPNILNVPSNQPSNQSADHYAKLAQNSPKKKTPGKFESYARRQSKAKNSDKDVKTRTSFKIKVSYDFNKNSCILRDTCMFCDETYQRTHETLVKSILGDGCVFLKNMRGWVDNTVDEVRFCPICKSSFSSLVEYAQHQIDSHPSRLIDCSICQQPVKLGDVSSHKFDHFATFGDSNVITCRAPCTFSATSFQFFTHLETVHGVNKSNICRKKLLKFIDDDVSDIAYRKYACLSVHYAYAVLRDRKDANSSVDGGAGSGGEGGGDDGGEIGGEDDGNV